MVRMSVGEVALTWTQWLMGSTASEAPSRLEVGSTNQESTVPSKVESTKSVNWAGLRSAMS